MVTLAAENQTFSEGFNPPRAMVFAGRKARIKLTKVVRSICEAFDENDVSTVVRVYREAMNATKTFFMGPCNGEKHGAWVTEPDHKTRINAANMVAAYHEGLPVQRQIQMRTEFRELGDMLSAMKESGEARRLMPGLDSIPSAPERSE